jgi:hypothetical protein
MRKVNQPSADLWREHANSLFYDRMKSAREPALGKREADCLIRFKLIGERYIPLLPEAVIASACVEKPGALIDVIRPKAAAKQVPQCVEGGVQD